MSSITIKGLKKTYRSLHTVALAHIDLHMKSKELLAIVGPSGCGKSTLLRCIAGLERTDGGEIFFGTREMSSVPPHLRETVMLFQDILLFPHLSIFENVAFGLRVRKTPPKTITERVHEILEQVQLSHAIHKRPHQISGGEQKRIALARALVVRPNILLLDEPLSNLDRHLWRDMGYLIRDLHNRHQITTILVTHNQEEALLLGDNIAVMFNGRIAQVGSDAQLYRHPLTIQIARFFDTCNIYRATKKGGGIHAECGVLRAPTVGPYRDCPDGAVMFGVRPEDVSHDTKDTNTLCGTVLSSRFTGTQWRIRIRVGTTEWETLWREHCAEGATVSIHIPAERIMLFEA